MPPRASRRAPKRAATTIDSEKFGAAYNTLVRDEFHKQGARLHASVMPSMHNPLCAADWRAHMAHQDHPVNLALAEAAADAGLLANERLADTLHRHSLKEWRSKGEADEDRSRAVDGEGVLALLVARYLASYNARMQSLQTRWGTRLDVEARRAVWDAIDVMAVPMKDSSLPALQRALDAVATAPADEVALGDLVAALLERNRGQGHTEVLAQVECALLQLDELSKTMCDEVPNAEAPPAPAEAPPASAEAAPLGAEPVAMEIAAEAPPEKNPAKRRGAPVEASPAEVVHSQAPLQVAPEQPQDELPVHRARLAALPSWAEPVAKLEAVPLSGVNKPIFGNQNEWLDRLRKIYTDEQRSRMRSV